MEPQWILPEVSNSHCGALVGLIIWKSRQTKQPSPSFEVKRVMSTPRSRCCSIRIAVLCLQMNKAAPVVYIRTLDAVSAAVYSAGCSSESMALSMFEEPTKPSYTDGEYLWPDLQSLQLSNFRQPLLTSSVLSRLYFRTCSTNLFLWNIRSSSLNLRPHCPQRKTYSTEKKLRWRDHSSR
jgi:hypothetical protein